MDTRTLTIEECQNIRAIKQRLGAHAFGAFLALRPQLKRAFPLCSALYGLDHPVRLPSPLRPKNV